MRQLVAVVVVAWVGGCATVVTPPAKVADPVTVYVLDYGYHASLAAPAADGGLVEFAYGEWGWYAEGRCGWWRVPGIVFWPSQGTLGKRPIGVENPTTEALSRLTGASPVHEVVVERRRMEAWRDGMLARWESAERRENREHAMTFVRVEEDYWVFRTCNSAVARWLRELGCGTSWGTVTADFEVTDVTRSPDATGAR